MNLEMIKINCNELFILEFKVLNIEIRSLEDRAH